MFALANVDQVIETMESELRLALLRRAPRRLALLRQLVDRVTQLRLHRLDHLTNASANINATF